MLRIAYVPSKSSRRHLGVVPAGLKRGPKKGVAMKCLAMVVGMVPALALAATPVTPASGGPVSATSVLINGSSGDQVDPHVSGNLAAYTDVQEQIVQFDVASDSLIWTADGQRFPGYPVSGNFVATDKHFQIRFGTKDGERRAYFTETASATICDIAVSGGHLLISPTTVPVPGGG
jgi:hypothetical protein